MLDHTHGSGSFQHHAISEAPWATQLHTSAPGRASIQRRSLRLTEGPQPVLADRMFQQSYKSASSWSPNQTVFKKENATVQGQNGVGMFGAVPPDNELSWLAQVKEKSEGLRRQNSYPPSIISAEVQLGKTMQADLSIPKIQAHSSVIL